MTHLLDNIPVETTLEQALAKLRIPEEEDIVLVTGLFDQAKKIVRPKVLYKEVYVDEVSGANVTIDGRRFNSNVLAMNLKNVHRAFAYICTCGTEVDIWSHNEKDYVVSVWLDMIKEMFLHEATNYFRAHTKRVYQFDKVSNVNPGSGDAANWPISQQTVLFDLIGEVKEKTGVELTEGYLMIPTKSTSGIMFPSETEFVNCALCRRENCRGRRAPFDGDLYEKALLAV